MKIYTCVGPFCTEDDIQRLASRYAMRKLKYYSSLVGDGKTISCRVCGVQVFLSKEANTITALIQGDAVRGLHEIWFGDR